MIAPFYSAPFTRAAIVVEIRPVGIQNIAADNAHEVVASGTLDFVAGFHAL
jgi:hypothetical protein